MRQKPARISAPVMLGGLELVVMVYSVGSRRARRAWYQRAAARAGLSRLRAAVLGAALAALLGACQTPPPAATAALARCEALFAAQDRAIAAAGLGRTHPARIAGFPYLRSDRLLASYAGELTTAARRDAWLRRLAQQDATARAGELALLSPALRAGLLPAGAADLATRTEDCRQQLLARDRAAPERLTLLRERARVPDEYSELQRVLGLYPLAFPGLRAGVLRWQAATRASWETPLPALQGKAPLRYYAPAVPAANASPGTLDDDVLGLPRPSGEQLAQLFRRHAPVWVIATASTADRPGAPLRTAAGPTVDPAQPLAYHYATLTRFRGRARLQLNYLLWFSERPKRGLLDLLGGRLDGVIWRVTIDATGTPLAWDSVHACGCYHLFFPGPGVSPRPGLGELPEPPLVLPALTPPAPGERMHLFLSAGDHYLQRAWPAPVAAVHARYKLAEREELYRAPAPGGGRGLFGEDGLVPGSERGERWYLWPSGVPSPGAMRERGRRATAFLGRRHFDDPFLLDRVFR